MGEQPLITDNAIEMRTALPQGGALLGLDLGTRPIGIAVCDAGWRFATRGKTLARGKFSRDREALGHMVRERRVAGIVPGLRRKMVDSERPRTPSDRASSRKHGETFALHVIHRAERRLRL